MIETSNGSERRIRAVVLYRHLLLRDLVVCLLGNAGIDVIAAIQDEDLGPTVLRVLQPDVIVVDQAAKQLQEDFAANVGMFDARPESLSRVVTVGLQDTAMVVCSRQLVEPATAESLVEAVLGDTTSPAGHLPEGNSPYDLPMPGL